MHLSANAEFLTAPNSLLLYQLQPLHLETLRLPVTYGQRLAVGTQECSGNLVTEYIPLREHNSSRYQCW